MNRIFLLGACASGESLFTVPDANFRSILANGQVIDKNQFQDSISSGYTFPNQANQYIIEANLLNPAIIDRAGIIAGTSGSNVDTYDVLLDQLPIYPQLKGSINQLVLADPKSRIPSTGVSFIITKTNDGQPPRNIILRVEGCDKIFLSTKAQIEGTTSQSSLYMIRIIVTNFI